MRPLSDSTARIASRNFTRKYVALGRLIEQWDDIVGKEFSDLAQPLKINYRKNQKAKKAIASLDIGVHSAHIMVLSYQKDLIIQRLGHIFGDNWISDIRFVRTTLKPTNKAQKAKKTFLPLTQDEKKYLSTVLDDIDDLDFKNKLESLGNAILTDEKK